MYVQPLHLVGNFMQCAFRCVLQFANFLRVVSACHSQFIIPFFRLFSLFSFGDSGRDRDCTRILLLSGTLQYRSKLTQVQECLVILPREAHTYATPSISQSVKSYRNIAINRWNTFVGPTVLRYLVPGIIRKFVEGLKNKKRGRWREISSEVGAGGITSTGVQQQTDAFLQPHASAVAMNHTRWCASSFWSSGSSRVAERTGITTAVYP